MPNRRERRRASPTFQPAAGMRHVLPASKVDPYHVTEHQRSEIKRWRDMGYSIPQTDRGEPVFPQDPRYNRMTERATSNPDLRTRPRGDVRLFDASAPGEEKESMTLDAIRKNAQKRWNVAYAKARTKKKDFKNLDEYREWYNRGKENIPGAYLIEDDIERQFREHMPENVRKEYEQEKISEDVARNLWKQKEQIEQYWLLGEYDTAPGGLVKREPSVVEQEEQNLIARRELIKRGGLEREWRATPEGYEKIEQEETPPARSPEFQALPPGVRETLEKRRNKLMAQKTLHDLGQLGDDGKPVEWNPNLQSQLDKLNEMREPQPKMMDAGTNKYFDRYLQLIDMLPHVTEQKQRRIERAIQRLEQRYPQFRGWLRRKTGNG